MSKTYTYTRNGLIIGGAVNGVINVVTQLNKISAHEQEKFEWKQLLFAVGKGSAIGGLTGLAIGAITDFENSLEEPLDTDAFLGGMVNRLRLKKDNIIYKELCFVADRIIECLKNKLGDKIAGEPFRIGSTEKGTALNFDFDVDVSISFKPGSFNSTRDMFYSVLEEIETCVGLYEIVRIRDQKKSIGVIVNIQGEEYKIDVVPCKLTNVGKNTSGYLFVNSSSYFLDNSSYTKTDTKLLSSQKLTETQKRLVITLKNWKIYNDIPISGFLIENLVLESYKHNKNRIPKSFTQKLIMVLDYTAAYLDVKIIRSIENTNNVLNDLSTENMSIIINSCKKILKDYDYQPNTIINHFESL